MAKLPMTALCTHLHPSVSFNQGNQITDLHRRKRTIERQSRLTTLPFSGVVPSASEDRDRCNGGLGSGHVPQEFAASRMSLLPVRLHLSF